jgi:hypothetical protein
MIDIHMFDMENAHAIGIGIDIGTGTLGTRGGKHVNRV